VDDDLLAFLRARFDDDERPARAATAGPWRHNPDKHWRKPGTSWFEEAVFSGAPGENAVCVAGTGETDDPQSMADAAFIAHHDPARVLAEVEAKRRLVKLHEPVVLRGGAGAQYFETTTVCRSCEPPRQFPENAFPCPTLRVLALPHADHPDYREEWKP
jgi:hypothetical protein